LETVSTYGEADHIREKMHVEKRNEYQEFSGGGGVRDGLRVRLTTLPPYVSQLSREKLGASMSHSPMDLHGLLQG
jgi:hypothetical protein